MKISVASLFGSLMVLVAVVCALGSPALALAQNVGEYNLQMAVRNALLADPAVQKMPQAEVDNLVAGLVDEAQKQGVTVADLTWRPRTPASFLPQMIAEPYQVAVEPTQPDWCGPVPSLLCMFGMSFGLIGTAYGIPIALGTICMVLIVVIGYSLAHHRAAASQTPQA